MPEPNERQELSGLARSIDALFTKGPSDPAPRVTVEEAEPALPDPDPFDALDALLDEPDETDGLDLAVEDAPTHDLGWPEDLARDDDGWSEDLALEDDGWSENVAPEDDGSSADLIREDVGWPGADGLDDAASTDEGGGEQEAPASPDVPPGPPASALAEAVDAFLAGHPGAAAEVESVAEQLHERLALDPLADAIEQLVDAADSGADDPALDMAGRIVTPAVASRIVQRMSHEEDEDRRAEYIALAERLGTVMANAFKGALTDATDARTRRACHDGLIAMGETGRPVIEAMIEDDNAFLAQSAVSILGEMGGEGASELVTSALANPDFRVRREALAALAKLGSEESGQLVLASLEDSSPRVRAAAAEAAGRLGVERSLRPILAILDDDTIDDDDKVEVHVQVLGALGHLGDPGAVPAIEKRAVGSLFSRPPTEIRVAAYRALHSIGSPHARQLVDKARDDKDPVVRTTVRGLASTA